MTFLVVPLVMLVLAWAAYGMALAYSCGVAIGRNAELHRLSGVFSAEFDRLSERLAERFDRLSGELVERLDDDRPFDNTDEYYIGYRKAIAEVQARVLDVFESMAVENAVAELSVPATDEDA